MLERQRHSKLRLVPLEWSIVRAFNDCAGLLEFTLQRVLSGTHAEAWTPTPVRAVNDPSAVTRCSATSYGTAQKTAQENKSIADSNAESLSSSPFEIGEPDHETVRDQ